MSKKEKREVVFLNKYTNGKTREQVIERLNHISFEPLFNLGLFLKKQSGQIEK